MLGGTARSPWRGERVIIGAGWIGRIEAQGIGIAEATVDPEGAAWRIAVERVGAGLERITIGAGPKMG